MRVLLSLLVIGLAAAASARHVRDIEQEWETFKLTHNKQYSEVEDTFRMKVFSENMAEIAEHNQLFVEGKTSFAMKMNKFGDLLHSEFVSTMNGYRGDSAVDRSGHATFIAPDSDVVLPDSVDWRQKGAVTPVKSQGKCGSCWAFSATGSLEGQHFLSDGQLVSLSEQDLVDCSKKNHGCDGGNMDLAFEDIKLAGGIDTEASYPYVAHGEQCMFNKSNIGATDAGYINIPSGDEAALKAAVAVIGPISVAVDASQASFVHYSGGVYSDPKCSPTSLDHGVLVVGYGNMHGMDYWLVKNSWTEEWGDKGYIYMARNDGNMCGIASMASFPLV